MFDILEKIDTIPLKQKKSISRFCKINLSRRSFYCFCKTLFPNIYNSEHAYLEKVCNDLQRMFENKVIMKETGNPAKFLHLNLPPRFYKSFTIGLFAAWVLGLNYKNQIITVCYSMKLALILSRNVRNHINQPQKIGSNHIVYRDIFPETFIKKGHSAVGEWAVGDAHMSFMATSFGSPITGFGANSLIIIDDQIKDSFDASNEILLADNWDWFCNTFWSRLEINTKLIVNMTRWNDNDFCGRMLQMEIMRKLTHVIRYPVINRNTGEMLCPAIMSSENFGILIEVLNKSILSANYYQIPINSEGRLFQEIKTYSKDTAKFDINSSNLDIRCAIDPCGDKGGGDYYCAVSYIVHDKKAYVTDIFYENEAKKITDECLCKFLIKNRVKSFRIEANKDSRVGEDIITELKDKFGVMDIKYKPFDSCSNKIIRIYLSSNWIQAYIYFPDGWDKRYPKPYTNYIGYQYPGKNAHDDFEDVLSEIKEDVHNTVQLNNRMMVAQVPRNQLSIEEVYFGQS